MDPLHVGAAPAARRAPLLALPVGRRFKRPPRLSPISWSGFSILYRNDAHAIGATALRKSEP
jgi:hypothetical protein